MLYNLRNFEIFRLWTAIWTPLLVFGGACLVFESGRPHGRILVGIVFICPWLLYLAIVADIVTILSCLCYNLNVQKLSSNTLSTQLPNVLSNLICFNLAALYKTSNSLVNLHFEIIGAETQAELEVKDYQNITLCGARF